MYKSSISLANTLSLNLTNIVLLSILVGLGAAFFPIILVIPIILLFFLTIIKSSFSRFLYVVLGSLFIFQSSSGLGILKILFLLGLLVVSVLSFYNVNNTIKEKKLENIKKIVYSGFLYIVYLMFSTFYSILNGVDFFTAIRENSPYFIFAMMPILALDFALKSKIRNVKVTLIVSGIYATFACVITWYQRRYSLEIENTTNIGFASYMLAYGFFTLACTNALKLKRNVLGWSVVCGIVLSGLAITGTRTTFFVLPFVFLYIAFIGKEFSFTFKLFRMLKVISYITIFTVISSYVILNIIDFDKNAFYQRLKSSLVVFESNSNDLSINGRISQSKSAIEAIKSSPLIGKGGGYIFESRNYRGEPEFRTSIDTPLSLLAKQGLIGAVLFLNVILSIILYLKKSNIKNKLSWYYMNGYIICSLITMFILSIGEDKGFSLAMILFLTYSLCESINEKENTLDSNMSL